MPTEILQAINTGGVVALLLIILYAGFSGRFVFGWQYREMQASCKERIDKLEAQREEALKSSERTVAVAEAMMAHIRDRKA